jgi:hypothetical protein
MSECAYISGATGAVEKASSLITSQETAAMLKTVAANKYLNIFIIASL